MASGASKERFVVLDGMRGLAALAVITDHVPSSLMMSLLPGRYLAVDFFFVLSGFVLAHVYSDKLSAGMTPLSFMRLRLVRLYPLYLVGVLIGAAWATTFVLKGWFDMPLMNVATSLAFALVLLPCPPSLSLWPSAPFVLNGPSWSLFFELFINAVFALVARWLTPALCLGFMAVGGVLLVPTAFGFGQLDGGFAWSNFIAGFPRVTFGFFAGVWLYRMRSRWSAPSLPAWAAYGGLALVFMVPAQGVWRAAFDLFAVLVLFPALVAFSAGTQAHGALLRVSTVIGVLSYGVYILHVPLWEWIRLGLEYFALDALLPGVVKVLLTAAVALGAAAILHAVYDVPARRFLSGRRPRPAITSAPGGE